MKSVASNGLWGCVESLGKVPIVAHNILLHVGLHIQDSYAHHYFLLEWFLLSCRQYMFWLYEILLVWFMLGDMKAIYYLLLNLCCIYDICNGIFLKTNNALNYIKQNRNLNQYSIAKSGASKLDKVNFMLYTFGRSEPFIFDVNTDPKLLIQTGFDVKKMTKFVAHGWVITGAEFVPQFAKGIYI